MPQVILNEQLIQPATLFFTRDIDQHKNMSLSQLYQPPRTPFSQNTYHQLLSSCEYCKVFKNSFLQNTFRSSHFQMFFKIGAQNSFANFTGKHLCWSLFLKYLQAEGLQLHYKKTPTQVFFLKVCENFKNTFVYRTPLVTASVPLLYFFKKVIKQLFHNFVMTY